MKQSMTARRTARGFAAGTAGNARMADYRPRGSGEGECVDDERAGGRIVRASPSTMDSSTLYASAGMECTRHNGGKNGGAHVDWLGEYGNPAVVPGGGFRGRPARFMPED